MMNFEELQSDAQKDGQRDNTMNISNTMNSINTNVVSEIQKELEPGDMISLVFLLYNVPDTAMQRILVYQRVCKDIGTTNSDLLSNWALHAQSRNSWKYEFLEALATCQLFSIIRKIGFDVTTVKNYFPIDSNVSVYINPMKKALYRLSEQMTSDSLLRLKKTLLTYDIDTTEYETCELLLLSLLCKKFIVINNTNRDSEYQVETLVKIIHNFPGLKKIALELQEIQSMLNSGNISQLISTSTPSTSMNIKKDDNIPKYYDKGFDDIHDMMEQFLNKMPVEDLKSDSSKLNLGDNVYAIKNPKRIGVCYIINQEEFHPSKESIENGTAPQPLTDRLGSTRDKRVLENTLTSLKFEVISHSNLDHKRMIQCIKDIIKYRVQHDDSIFLLCILSHGIRDHVFAADSVKVKIEDIQNILDADDALHLRGIPKVMILQACQVDDPHPNIVADSPNVIPKYYMRKSDFLIYWATSPELEAFRDKKNGSIFIQILCYVIQKQSKSEHLYDIFTRVTDVVIRICSCLEKDQVPIFKSTLRKKIYLQIPERP